MRLLHRRVQSHEEASSCKCARWDVSADQRCSRKENLHGLIHSVLDRLGKIKEKNVRTVECRISISFLQKPRSMKPSISD